MKVKTWISWLIAAICFAIAGIISLIEKKYLIGIVYIILGAIYINFSITSYKKGSNKSNENTLSDEELKNLDNELRKLISDGKRTKAIKKYRMVTGADLIKAKEYVDSLIKGSTK